VQIYNFKLQFMQEKPNF